MASEMKTPRDLKLVREGDIRHIYLVLFFVSKKIDGKLHCYVLNIYYSLSHYPFPATK